MIKLENVVLASPEQMEFIVEGMRNPMNSWEKSDSGNGCDSDLCSGPCAFSPQWCGNTPRCDTVIRHWISYMVEFCSLHIL